MWPLSFFVVVGCCVAGIPVKSGVQKDKKESIWQTRWATDAESADNINAKNGGSFDNFGSIDNKLSFKVSGVAAQR